MWQQEAGCCGLGNVREPGGTRKKVWMDRNLGREGAGGQESGGEGEGGQESGAACGMSWLHKENLFSGVQKPLQACWDLCR